MPEETTCPFLPKPSPNVARYITRPAISEQRLSISPQGRVRYQLTTPWRKPPKILSGLTMTNGFASFNQRQR